MLRRLGKTLGRIIGAIILIAWIAVFAFWIRSHWRGDLLVADWTSEMPKVDGYTVLTYRARTLVVVAFSGQGGLCLALRDMDQVLRPSPVPPRRDWLVMDKPEYPSPSMWAARASAGGLVGSGNTLVVSSGNPTSPNIRRLPASASPPTPAPAPAPLTGVITSPSTPSTGFSQFLFYTASTPLNSSQFRDLSRVIIVPYWSVVIALALPALVLNLGTVRWMLRRRRVGAGCCANCGYDLRATPQRCPECGKVSKSMATGPSSDPRTLNA